MDNLDEHLALDFIQPYSYPSIAFQDDPAIFIKCLVGNKLVDDPAACDGPYLSCVLGLTPICLAWQAADRDRAASACTSLLCILHDRYDLFVYPQAEIEVATRAGQGSAYKGDCRFEHMTSCRL